MATEITCIVPYTTDAGARIDRVGGPWGTKGEADIIEEIQSGIKYFVEVDGELVDVIVARRNGEPYLRTDPDHSAANNPLSLPRCP
jgi:hypothetical protein